METLRFDLAAPTPATGARKMALVGVVASGNLEVLLEREGPADRCTVEINTSAPVGQILDGLHFHLITIWQTSDDWLRLYQRVPPGSAGPAATP